MAASDRKWTSFLWSADEWIINYAVPPHTLAGVKLFSIGQALELYLKATYAKRTGNIDKAIRFGHKIDKLWAWCKSDPAFLPTFELRQQVLDINFMDHQEMAKLPKEDLLHYAEFQEIYIVARHLLDLKYLGTPLKSIQGPYAFGTMWQHPMWASLFKDLRAYLGFPGPDDPDKLRYYIEEIDLPTSVKQYLSGFLSH